MMTALAAALAMTLPALVLAAPRVPAPRVVVDCDASALKESAGPVGGEISKRLTLLLRGAGVWTGDATPDAVVRVVVARPPAQEVGYRVELLPGPGRTFDERSIECDLCIESELFERIDGELLDIVHGLEPTGEGAAARDSALTSQRAASPSPAHIEPPRPPSPGAEPHDRRRRLGRLGIAGIAVQVLGVAALGTGVGLWARGVEPSAADPRNLVDRRPPGYALVATGGAALAAGVILLVVDQRPRPRAARRGRARFGAGGTSISVRF